MITRPQIRGKPLDEACKRANITTGEYGESDNRVFCYGLYKEQSVTEVRDVCLKCKAYVYNAEPLKKTEDEKYAELKKEYTEGEDTE